MKVDVSDEGITIDVYCVIEFGLSIPKVSTAVQENIRQTLFEHDCLND